MPAIARSRVDLPESIVTNQCNALALLDFNIDTAKRRNVLRRWSAVPMTKYRHRQGFQAAAHVGAQRILEHAVLYLDCSGAERRVSVASSTPGRGFWYTPAPSDRSESTTRKPLACPSPVKSIFLWHFAGQRYWCDATPSQRLRPERLALPGKRTLQQISMAIATDSGSVILKTSF